MNPPLTQKEIEERILWANRIKEVVHLLKKEGIIRSEREFAKRIGYSQPSISAALSLKRVDRWPTNYMLGKIRTAFGVRKEYLKKGEMPIMKNEIEAKVNNIEPVKPSFNGQHNYFNIELSSGAAQITLPKKITEEDVEILKKWISEYKIPKPEMVMIDKSELEELMAFVRASKKST